MSHWAASLIGLPWTTERNCWFIVRAAFERQHGIVLPELAIGRGVEDNVAAIKASVSLIGFRPAAGEPIPGDIVLMRGQANERHVGVMIQMSKGPRMLHSDQSFGEVICQPLADVRALGFRELEAWRAAA